MEQWKREQEAIAARHEATMDAITQAAQGVMRQVAQLGKALSG